MATMPNTESGLVTLAQNIIDGITAYPTLFPGLTPQELSDALEAFNVALTAQQKARASAQLATEAKNLEQGYLNTAIRKYVRQAEVDCINEPGNLLLIGWGPKAQPVPIAAPGSPTNLRSLSQEFDSVSFVWEKPRTGGAVRNYALYRTTVDPESGLAHWTLVDFYYSNEATATNQPRGVQLYYKVNAVNAGGTGPNSNTLPVVL